MSADDITTLKKTFGQPTPLWKKAFDDYNSEPNQKPLRMNCRPCWMKVLQYHLSKQNES